MALDAETAMEKLQRLIASSWVTASYDNAYWMLAIMYEKGQQWASVNNVTGQMNVAYLRNLTDPQRRDVRVTMNKIGELVRQVYAEINPPSFRGTKYNPASGSVDDRLIAGLSSRLMKQHIKDIHGLKVYRDVNRARTVLGTCGLRRTLTLRGQRIFGSIEDGNIMQRPVKEYSIGWARTYPWEFLRDPAAVSLDIEEEENIICHYKPRTVQWVRDNFRGVEIKTESTMGRLMTFNRQVRAASGMVGNSRVANSREPAVMVYECYFKDGNGWPDMLYAFGDPLGGDKQLKKIVFLPNPFFGIPFHFFHYERSSIQMPWARGIPHLLMASQDITNLAWTWLLRTMQAGAGKWIVERGTVERPQRALKNRIDEFIEFNPGGANNPAQAKAPTFIGGAQPSESAMQVIARTPEGMANALNLSPVQRGITSKRGESGPAIAAKLQQAGVPLDDLRRDDELELEKLFQATLYDMTNKKWIRQDIVRSLLGKDVPRTQVSLMVRKGTQQAVGSVTMHPSTLRPRTNAEVKEDFMSLVDRGVVDAQDAQWELNLQSGINTNTGMSRSMDKQMDEISRMEAGADVHPAIADHHNYHIRAIMEYVDSPQWHNQSQSVRDRINTHFVEHKAAELQISQLNALGAENAQEQGPPAQGTPPANPADIPLPVPGGAAAPPELAVA